MKYVVLVFVLLLSGCSHVVYVGNGGAGDDCSSSVEITTTGITAIDECSDGKTETKIKLE